MLYVRARVRARTAYTISEQNGFFRAGFHPHVTRLTPYFFYIYIKVAKLRGHIVKCGLLPYAAVVEKITASELRAPIGKLQAVPHLVQLQGCQFLAQGQEIRLRWWTSSRRQGICKPAALLQPQLRKEAHNHTSISVRRRRGNAGVWYP